jgi:hypothetical protein
MNACRFLFWVSFFPMKVVVVILVRKFRDRTTEYVTSQDRTLFFEEMDEEERAEDAFEKK